jgi:predicted heme/steroid binding protein
MKKLLFSLTILLALFLAACETAPETDTETPPTQEQTSDDSTESDVDDTAQDNDTIQNDEPTDDSDETTADEPDETTADEPDETTADEPDETTADEPDETQVDDEALEETVAPGFVNSNGELELTIQDLAYYNGRDGKKAYVAVDGIVYDVTNSSKWTGGSHFGGATAGRDLTAAMDANPSHGRENLSRVPRIGIIVTSYSEDES